MHPLKGIVATDVTAAISPLGSKQAIVRALNANEQFQMQGRAVQRGNLPVSFNLENLPPNKLGGPAADTITISSLNQFKTVKSAE